MPFQIVKYTALICDKCGESTAINTSNPKDARKYGWMISKDYKKCYCPNCAIKIRYPKWYREKGYKYK